MLFALVLVLSITYFCLLLLFIIGSYRLGSSSLSYEKRTVSVVVAARNEEVSIHRCLESLANLDYPREKLEVILVDDQSSDRTYEIMRSFSANHPHFKTLKVTDRIGHLKGKANAIALGIESSHGELIFLTDADCVVPRSWVDVIVSQYTDAVGLVASYTLLESRNSFEGMQSLDWAFLHTLAAGGVGLKIPLSCFGNNLTFRRSAYDEVGGYREIPFSVTEDFALFTALTKKTKWQYSYLITPASLVISLPCQTWREILEQKQRWVIGGLGLKLRGYLLITLAVSLNLLLVGSLFLGWPLTSILALWIPKAAADGLLITTALKRTGQLLLLKYFPIYEVYYFVYILTIPYLLLSRRKVVWKGREF